MQLGRIDLWTTIISDIFFFTCEPAGIRSLLLLLLSCFSCVWLSATPWTVAPQAPLSMGFSRQELWSGLPCPLPGNLPDPGIEPTSLKSPALAGGCFITSALGSTLSPRLFSLSAFHSLCDQLPLLEWLFHGSCCGFDSCTWKQLIPGLLSEG